MTGFGGNLIIIDDPMNASDAQSLPALKKVQDYHASLVTRLDDPAKGAIILVMQRLHEDDLAGYLLTRQPGAWTELKLAAIAEADEEIEIGGGKSHKRMNKDLLDPKRMTHQHLDMMRTTLGSAAFSAQFQQSPVPADGNRLKRSWLKFYTQLPTVTEGKVTQSWDTAMKGHAGADYSVCTTWLEHGGNHYLIDVLRERLELPALIKRALEQFERHRPAAVLVEDHASGTSLLQHLQAHSGVPAIGWRADKNKEVRFDRVLPLFEAGRVFVPEEAPWMATLLTELLGFPSTRHDDQVDSVSQYLWWAFERSSQAQFNCDWLDYDQDPTPDALAQWWIDRPILRPPR